MSSGLAEADQVPVRPSLAGLVGGHDSVAEENVKEVMECPVIDEISLKFKPANTVRSVLTLHRHIYDKTIDTIVSMIKLRKVTISLPRPFPSLCSDPCETIPSLAKAYD